MPTEREAVKQFESCVPKEYFSIHPQCRGKAVFVKKLKRLFAEWDGRTEPQGGVIDFILEPTELLKERGWKIGCVGVEIKSTKILKDRPGKAIAQILDYQACSYKLPSSIDTELSMIFLFPYRYSAKLLGSIMQQEGLGFVRYIPKLNLFQLLQANSNEPVFSLQNGEVIVRKPRFGKRFGHR